MLLSVANKMKENDKHRVVYMKINSNDMTKSFKEQEISRKTLF